MTQKISNKEIAEAVAATANSKAAEKLSIAIQGIVGLAHNALDYAVGPNRIKSIAQARGEALVLSALAESEADVLRQSAARRLLDRECRNQININAIAHEAYKSLPPPEISISDEPISEDFIHRFFDESQGIGNEEMQQIWGRLLAGEIVRPKSYHPQTLSVLKDLTPTDATNLSIIRKFICSEIPLIYDHKNKIYTDQGINFRMINELESLGLLHFLPLGEYTSEISSHGSVFQYNGYKVILRLKQGTTTLTTGIIALTRAGRELINLCPEEQASGFLDFLAHRWRSQGHEVIIINSRGIQENI